MTLEEYIKERDQILSDELTPSIENASYPVYGEAPVSRVGMIGSQSFHGPTGAGGFLPFIPITGAEEAAADPEQEYQQVKERIQVKESIGDKVQARQESETRADPQGVKEQILRETVSAINPQGTKESILQETASEADPQRNKVRLLQETVSGTDPAGQKSSVIQKPVSGNELIKTSANSEAVEILPEGNYQPAQSLEDWYKEQGIYARNETGTGAGRYFTEAPQATGKNSMSFSEYAKNYLISKNENIGETLAVQGAASMLAAPVIAVAGATGAAGTAAASARALNEAKISQGIAEAFSSLSQAGVKKAADSAFRQILAKGAAGATAATAARALVGAHAEEWNPSEQKMTVSKQVQTAPVKQMVVQNYGNVSTPNSTGVKQQVSYANSNAAKTKTANTAKVNSTTSTGTKTKTTYQKTSGASGPFYQTIPGR